MRVEMDLCVAYFLSKNLNTSKIKLKTNNRLLNAK